MTLLRQYAATEAETRARRLAALATGCLLDEVRLTPKPGLVDRRGSGAHQDLTLALMERSAHSLTPAFQALALACWQQPADVALRQRVGQLGREAEACMLQATGGVNTHRGAIWALGLLVCGAAMTADSQDAVGSGAEALTLRGNAAALSGTAVVTWGANAAPGTGAETAARGATIAVGTGTAAATRRENATICSGEQAMTRVVKAAARLARLPDAQMPRQFSNGQRASARYRLPGAREEAQQGFPHITDLALPQLHASRQQGATEEQAQLDALLAMMTTLSDTCVLSRAGLAGLTAMQQGARAVLAAGGVSQPAGWTALVQLDRQMLAANASPGGAADLLAATLFLDRLSRGG